MKEEDTIKHRATPKNILLLAQEGFLDIHSYERALKIIGVTPDKDKWNRFLDIVLLVLGSGFTLSGIYFFFAYNWADMHRFVKLGIIELFIVCLVFSAFIISLEKITGKIILTVAGVLIGALLAVYGQIYQTGADSYTLFLYWTLFMMGWVFISRFAPMWFIWILLINTSLFLYWDQMVGYIDEPQLWLYGVVINGLFILMWEFFSTKMDWLTSRWAPRTVSVAVFYLITAAAVLFVVDEWDKDPYVAILSIIFLLVNAVTLYIYSQKNLDLFMLTISAISLMIVLDSWLANVLDSFDDFLPLILGIVIISQTAITVRLLLKTSKTWEARENQ